MADLKQKIRDVADRFAKAVIDTLRGMTLDELVGLVRLPVASTAGATAKAPARPTKAATARSTTTRKKATALAKAASKPAPKPLSPKLRAFRRVQGLYAGYLRGFTGATRERIRAINASKGAEAALAEMRKLLKTVPAKGTKAAATAATTKASRKLKITPERKAALKIHGTYIGLLRGLPKAQQTRMKALAKESGMEAAVEAMRGKGK